MSPRSTEISREPGRSTDDGLLTWVIKQANRRGLRVFLMPIIRLQKRGRDEWRGRIAPTDWDRWWTSYRAYIEHYAAIAQASDVALLSVGSELVSTESQRDRWRALIANVRAVFHGQLTYSANWDHFEPVTFWDQLDVAGVTGYQSLSDATDPSEHVLLRGFDGMRRRVDRWTRITGKPFILTEIGYASQVGAARAPWDYRSRPGAADPGLQLRCYRAMYRAWQGHPALAGLYVWNWFGEGGAEDRGYTPRGKPAAKLLQHWYSAPAAPASE